MQQNGTSCTANLSVQHKKNNFLPHFNGDLFFKYSSKRLYLRGLSDIGRKCWLNMIKGNIMELADPHILVYYIRFLSLEIITNYF